MGFVDILEMSKSDHILASFGKNGQLQNPNVWHSTVVNSILKIRIRIRVTIRVKVRVRVRTRVRVYSVHQTINSVHY